MDDGRSYVTDLRVGESLEIAGGPVTVRLESKSGQLARLRFLHGGDVSFRKLEPREGPPAYHIARHGLKFA